MGTKKNRKAMKTPMQEFIKYLEDLYPDTLYNTKKRIDFKQFIEKERTAITNAYYDGEKAAINDMVRASGKVFFFNLSKETSTNYYDNKFNND
jgi:ArsR family metal-binding transcriptional regulator